MMIRMMIIDDDSDNDTKNPTKLERQERSRLVVRGYRSDDKVERRWSEVDDDEIMKGETGEDI